MNTVLGFKCIDFFNSICLNWWALDSMRESPSKNKIGSDWEDATCCILLNRYASTPSWTLRCTHAHKYISYTHNTTPNNSNNHCSYLLDTCWRCDQTFSGLSTLRPCPSITMPPTTHSPNFLFSPTIIIPLFGYPRDLMTSAILSLGICASWKKSPFPHASSSILHLCSLLHRDKQRLAPAMWSVCNSLSKLALRTLVGSRSSRLNAKCLRSVYDKCHFIHFP